MLRATSRLATFGCKRRVVTVTATGRSSVLSNQLTAPLLVSFTDNRRYFSEKAPETSTESVEETLNKLFEESANGTEVFGTVTQNAVDQWTPTWYNIADQAINGIQSMHNLTGLEYGWSVVATTIALRMVLFPIMVYSQKTTSRMAHVQPELAVLKTNFERLGSPTRQERLTFATNMKALFKKYEVKPFMGLVGPLIQIPLFLGMFFGLKKMPGLFPEELRNGGMYWFTDLTVADPYYILPLTSCFTFVALIEMGKEQMLRQQPGQQGVLFLNFFRFMSVASLPICINFESALLCYWTTNNVITMGQTALLKAPTVKKAFGIWDLPKPPPGMPSSDLKSSFENIVKRMQGKPVTEEQAIAKHNKDLETKQLNARVAKLNREKRRQKRGITGVKNY